MGYMDSYADALKPNLQNDYTFKQYNQQPVAQGMSQQAQQYSSGADLSMPQYSQADISGGAAAPSAVAMGGASDPTSAAVQAGGSLLSGYMAQLAADKRAKRQAQMQIAQNQAAGETNAYNTLNNVYRGALR